MIGLASNERGVLGFRLNVSFSFLFMRIELCLVRLGRNVLHSQIIVWSFVIRFVRNSIFFMINYFFSFSLLFFAKPKPYCTYFHINIRFTYICRFHAFASYNLRFYLIKSTTLALSTCNIVSN
jgi:hypothetical protein